MLNLVLSRWEEKAGSVHNLKLFGGEEEGTIKLLGELHSIIIWGDSGQAGFYHTHVSHIIKQRCYDGLICPSIRQNNFSQSLFCLAGNEKNKTLVWINQKQNMPRNAVHFTECLNEG